MNASAPPPLLEMRGVRKRFGATVALDGVDLAVAAGEVHGLIGENGAGKSTLMKVLSGAERPDAGELRVAGEPYAPRSPHEGRRAGVAMIYQELSLAPHLSVAENLLLGAEPAAFGWVRRGRLRERAREALAQLGHADLDPDLRVGDLPVGLRQIVEIARALGVGCRILVLDEPTSSLGRSDLERLSRLVARLRGQGLAIVYISHFLEEVQRMADRYTVLRDGRSVGTGRVADAGAADWIDLMVGRRIDELYPRSARAPGEVLLDVAELAGAPRPEAASLQVRRGEVVGIAGLVGAGRTELLRAVFGLAPVRAGRVRVGVHTGSAGPAARWEQGAGFVSEDRAREGLALSMGLADNIVLARLPGAFGTPASRARAAGPWLRELDVRCAGPSQRAGRLSGGNQQKVALARLLHADVDLWLLDEPTRGIDVGSKARVYRLIDDLAAGRAGGRPRAVLIAGSYLPELLGICDRIAVMRRGRLGPLRPVAEWDARRLLAEASAGEAA
jgi:ribose transport system ATP-binding protein